MHFDEGYSINVYFVFYNLNYLGSIQNVQLVNANGTSQESTRNTHYYPFAMAIVTPINYHNYETTNSKKRLIIMLRAEKKPGIVLNNGNSRYCNDGNDYYILFNSILEAKEYIQTSNDLDIEYILYDYQGNVSLYYSK